MNRYEASMKEIKRYIKHNPKATKENWEKYAQENIFYSAFTLCVHYDVKNWEELKKKILSETNNNGIFGKFNK